MKNSTTKRRFDSGYGGWSVASRCLLCLAFLLAGTSVWAQTHRLTGRVTDDKDQAVVGASVIVKGTTQGITTDSDGNFTLDLPNGDATLVVSFIGYRTQEVPVIERGEMEPSEFMTEINTMITELVKNTEMKKGVNALMKNKIIGVCPNCGANVVEREKGWFCENRECRFVLWKDNAFFKRLGKRLDAHVADKLLRDGRVRLKDCKSAKGKTYNATVLLSCEADGRSKFSLEFEGGC